MRQLVWLVHVRMQTQWAARASSMNSTPGTMSALPSSRHSATLASICSRTSARISPVSPANSARKPCAAPDQAPHDMQRVGVCMWRTDRVRVRRDVCVWCSVLRWACGHVTQAVRMIQSCRPPLPPVMACSQLCAHAQGDSRLRLEHCLTPHARTVQQLRYAHTCSPHGLQALPLCAAAGCVCEV